MRLSLRFNIDKKDILPFDRMRTYCWHMKRLINSSRMMVIIWRVGLNHSRNRLTSTTRLLFVLAFLFSAFHIAMRS